MIPADQRPPSDDTLPLSYYAEAPSQEPRRSASPLRSGRVRTGVALVIIFILVYAGTFAAATYLDLANSVRKSGAHFFVQPEAGKPAEAAPIDPNGGKTINLVFMAQDTRQGALNNEIGSHIGDSGEHNADSNMIVQIAADRSYINVVSIPRDSIVDQAACTINGRTMPARKGVQYNSIFARAFNYFAGMDGVTPEEAGSSCAVASLSALTGLHIDGYVLSDFGGAQQMIDAIGGVDLCIPQPIDDFYTGLKLNAGMQHLDGRTGAEYARVRHNIGDGSDIGRTTRQQYLIKTLIHKVLKMNFVTNSDKLYQFVKQTLGTLRVSSNLADLNTLVGLAYSLRDFKVANFYARTVPIQPYPSNHNRVEWAPGADELWQTMKADKPIVAQTAPMPAGAGAAAGGQGTGASGSDSGAASGSSGTQTGSNSQGSASTGTYDPKTGLVTKADGTLIDPKTGGRVNPKTGMITDPVTGYAMGTADQYLLSTVCKVPAQE